MRKNETKIIKIKISLKNKVKSEEGGRKNEKKSKKKTKRNRIGEEKKKELNM